MNIFLTELEAFPDGINQLGRTREAKPEGQLEAGDVIHIGQRDGAFLLCTGLCSRHSSRTSAHQERVRRPGSAASVRRYFQSDNQLSVIVWYPVAVAAIYTAAEFYKATELQRHAVKCRCDSVSCRFESVRHNPAHQQSVAKITVEVQHNTRRDLRERQAKRHAVGGG